MDAGRAIVSFVLLKAFINENIKMGWAAFRGEVEATIEEKCRSVGASQGH